ncbi:MAG: DUF1858 domain-containing protein [Clostridia bacterium]|nr:DUF1858 domain-containing protein [Clostridia bacterium]
MEINKDTLIGDVLKQAPAVAPILMSMGMHCLGCPASKGESIGDACKAHGVDVNDILSKINAVTKK